MNRNMFLLPVFLCLVGCGERDREAIVAERVVGLPNQPVAILDIPGTAPNGDLTFAYARAATRMSDRTIVIADNLGVAVRYINDAGKLVRTVGREGGGPGEFQGVSWLGQCAPDSVFVWDTRQMRMSVFDRDGDFVRQYRTPADPTVTAMIGEVRCSRTGTFAFQGLPPRLYVPTPSNPGPQYRAPLWIADALGYTTHELEDIALGEARPMGKFTGIALSSDHMYVGSADSAFVDVYGIDGVLTGAIKVGVGLRRPTERHYEYAIDAQVGGGGTPEFRQEWRERLAEIPMPDYMPPYTGVFTDPQGTLWVVVSVPGDPTTQLRALDPEGIILGDVHLPPDIRILVVGRQYIIGAYEDEGGEPHVVVYEMAGFAQTPR